MSENKRIEKLKERYGKSKHGNFFVTDTIGVPHLFCITPKHVETASDHFSGMLDSAAIEHLERTGRPSCGMRGCNLMYAEHEQALLVHCSLDMKKGNQVHPELQDYLLASKEEAEEDNYAGFAFLDKRKGERDV